MELHKNIGKITSELKNGQNMPRLYIASKLTITQLYLFATERYIY